MHCLRNTICRLLVALMVWTPFQFAQASMLGTDQVVQSTAQLDRAKVLGAIDRSEVSSQLQAYGIDAAQAKDRVNAMSDEEVSKLAQNLDALPAGGLNGSGLVVLIIVGAIVWWAFTQNRR